MTFSYRDFAKIVLRSAVFGWVVALPFVAPASSTIFGGGPFYSGGYNVMNTLRASGYTTVMLWCIHVNASNGNLIYNDQLVVANGVYVGNAAWPAQLATLKTPPTSVRRIEVSVGSWGVNDFLSIQTLMNNYGTNTDSILYRNFLALKNATGADAIDFDDETLYDVATAVKFGRMLSSIGYKVTLCPYNNANFWQSVYNQLGRDIVDGVYLQCYAGGAGNNPATWNNYFGGLKVEPGMWCKNGNGCAQGSTAAEVQTQMTAWRNSAGIQGGFMWLYDDMLACSNGGTAADYARAINQAVDPLEVTPPVGFEAMTAYGERFIASSTPFTLRNSSAAPILWSLINTSAWLTASSVGDSIPAGGSVSIAVSLYPAAALSLPPAVYTSTLVFSNRTTGATTTRVFTLNTGVLNWPLLLTGFNASLIAPNTATAGNPGASPFDIPNNYSFYQVGLNGSTRGLPLNRAFLSRADAQSAFQFAPYGANNALLLGYNNPASGTLIFTAPQPLSALAVIATSANGGGQGTLVLNFSNGTKSPALKFNAQDWFYTVTNVALQGFGRLRLGASWNVEDNGSANPNLYQTTYNLASLGLTQTVSSITFTQPAGAGGQQTTAILGISGMPATVPVSPPSTLTARPGTNGTVRLDWTGSGGATGYNVKRATAGGGPYMVIGTLGATNFTDTGLENGLTYYYVVSANGASGEGSDSVEVKAMPGSYQAWCLTGNPVAYYPLDEATGPVARDRAGTNDGTNSGGYGHVVSGAPGGGFDSPHRAVHYDGLSGYTLLPRSIGATHFSIVVWVRTTTTGGSPHWYNGRGLVDGEVSGAANDFGVALVGTKAGFGIGNPDTTLVSNQRINDGFWHQVVATRDVGTGEMKLYVDGVLDNTRSGPTGARTAPPGLRLASLQTGGGFFNGQLSDVALYNRVLTAREVGTLYRAAGGLFYGIALANTWTGGTHVVLTWRGNAKLLEADELAGPWTTNNAVSPAVISPEGPRKFYRLQIE